MRLGDSLGGVQEHVVGGLKGIQQAHLLTENGQELFIGNRD